MTTELVIRFSLSIIFSFLFFSFSHRTIKKTRAGGIPKRAGLGLTCAYTGWGFLCIFISLEDWIMSNTFSMVVWNAVAWGFLIYALLMATLTFLEESFEESTKKRAGRHEARLTFILAFIFILTFGGYSVNRFGAFQGALWQKVYHSEKFYFSFTFRKLGWGNFAEDTKQKERNAEFVVREEGGRSGMFVIPIAMLEHAPTQDVLIEALSRNLGIDMNSPTVGAWKRQHQEGYEGFIFDFEAKVSEKVDFTYRTKLLQGKDFSYIVAAWVDSSDPDASSKLDDLLSQVEILAPGEKLPNWEEFNLEEQERHQDFFETVGDVYHDRGDHAQSADAYATAHGLSPENEALLQKTVEAMKLSDQVEEALAYLEKHGHEVEVVEEEETVELLLEKEEAPSPAEAPAPQKPAKSEEKKEDVRNKVEQTPRDLPLSHIRLPAGFEIGVFAWNVPNARGMTLAPDGTLFVGSRSEGKVYAVVDRDGDHQAEDVFEVGRGLTMPVGVAFLNGALFVSSLSRIVRYDKILSQITNPPKPTTVSDAFPTDRSHGWKFIAFGPDGKLYVPVGAPCNVCEQEDKRYASIMRMSVSGEELEVFASGIRNSVGFDWHPETGVLWFTENGRDLMGDDLPPDELNRAPKAGLHFGYPYCHGGDIRDPELGLTRGCEGYEPPVQKLGPHVAALGMRFYTGNMFPAEYQHQIFIAEHGSWNRSKKIGYRITLVRIEGSKAVSYETFASGWLQNEQVWGRPADVLVMPDGALLVSDDYAGAIYRISYEI